MKKIKILFTTPNFNTAGSGKVIFKIATRLNPNIFSPEIACLHNKGEMFNRINQSNIPIHVFPFIPTHSGIFSKIKSLYKTSRFFRLNKYDVIHSMNYTSDFTEPLSAKIAGVPWIYSKNNMSWGRRRWHFRTWLADRVFAQNMDMAKLFFEYSKKSHWVTDGVDLDEFKASNHKKEIFDSLQLQDGRNLITVANLVPIKKIELLINSFSKLIESYVNIKLIIVGSDTDEYAISLKKLCVSKKIETKVIFTGKVPNVIDYLNCAKIFVLPTASIGEGSPVALMEAMAAKVYSIGSDVSGIRDQLSGIPYHLFQPQNEIDLSAKLKHALELSESDFQKDIQKQYDKILLKFDLNKEIGILENHYLSIVSDFR